MKQLTAQPCTTDQYFLGECARYDEVREELYWVNVAPDRGQFFRARANGTDVEIIQQYDFPGSFTALAPRATLADGWIVAMDDSLFSLTEAGDLTRLASPEAHNHGAVRSNDGAADPWGVFWIGSMSRTAEAGRGSLYRYHETFGVETVFEDLTIANGIGWSPDNRTMYYVDSGPGTIHRYDVDDHGGISNQRLFARLDVDSEGAPDGLCVDVEGNVWVAVWGGYEVRQYAPSGEQIGSVKVDTRQPSCPTIGGANGTTLYITTAQEDMSQELLAREPNAGRVFACEVGVRGLPINPYRPTLRDIHDD